MVTVYVFVLQGFCATALNAVYFAVLYVPALLATLPFVLRTLAAAVDIRDPVHAVFAPNAAVVLPVLAYVHSSNKDRM